VKIDGNYPFNEGNYPFDKAGAKCAYCSGHAGALTPALIEAGAYIIEAETGCGWLAATDAARAVLSLLDGPEIIGVH
jgi:hypothetical protein